ncbi:MAG: NYN domain-containing protein [Phycisphaeraceae bacterium]|nr:NYN domain-containing protein [Phycisphaeraceae bacterium]
MPLLIDCYNVLHTPAPGRAGSDLTTATLCHQLAGTKWARYGITVFCDGLPKPDERFDPPANVQMVHSGPQRSADDLILARIEEEANPRRLVVVSSDRAIRAAARRRKANSWTSEEFLGRLQQQSATRPPRSAGKPGPLTEDQVDHWLRAFGFDEQGGRD